MREGRKAGYFCGKRVLLCGYPNNHDGESATNGTSSACVGVREALEVSAASRSGNGRQWIGFTPYGPDHERKTMFRMVVLQKGVGRGIYTER